MARNFKFATIVFTCIALLGDVKAQYISIPDANFVSWMGSTPLNMCLNGSQLDTNCATLLNVTIVVCSGNQISNLEGIEYFKNLKYLDCSNNLLGSLPHLPRTLKQLVCSQNVIDSLSVLPDSLISISCGGNNLSTLPILPATIVFMDCEYNKITKIPALPESLVNLNCQFNLLDSLPSLPNALDTLDCSLNLLQTLPPFPHSLSIIFCQQNQLTTMPYSATIKYIVCTDNMITTMPGYDSLQYLDCAVNRIRRLPAFTNTLKYLTCGENNIDSILYLPDSITEMLCEKDSLRYLRALPAAIQTFDCSSNKLTSLPSLPSTLTFLSCSNNLLTSLPELPSFMTTLGCENNPNLECLPKLTHIDYLQFDSTAITCIPNYGQVTTSIPPLGSVPLCVANNPHGCPSYTSLSEVRDLSFDIYPNPATNEVFVTLNNGQSNFTVELIDITGREEMITKMSQAIGQVSINQLPDGLYFVRVSDGLGRVGVRKVVIER